MTRRPKSILNTERATDLLNAGQALIDVSVDGRLIIETTNNWDKEIVIDNCAIEYFSASLTHFDKPVRLTNCHFKKCQFISTYFLCGLTIDNCTFDNYLDFQSGGHNKTGSSVIITNNVFNDFVNFFDCWYESELIICNNQFHKGTNLLGKPHKIPVTFDKEPLVKDNTGQLDLDDEGEIEK